MKAVIFIAISLLICSASYAQELENNYALLEQQAEIMADREGVENEDDSYLVQLYYFRKHPLNLNKAEASDLKKLLLLNDLQIENFLHYRNLLGPLLHLYELQAVPGWNINTIKKLLPFIRVTQNANLADNIKERWTNGENSLLIRSSRVLEKADGYQKKPDSVNHFMGNANRLLVRFTYNYRNLLQWGILGDKDAGEPFFKGKQKAGFDFYSFHFFISRLGLIKILAIGDFTVNMGQGLIQWQSMAFKKSAAITSVKRESPVLRPYTAAGEYNFHRGAGITIQKGKWEATFFLSTRKLSGNLVKDSANDAGHVSSILTSGYHRTPNEQADRNNLNQLAAGASLRYSVSSWQVAINAMQYHLSKPLQKADQPYNRFSSTGTNFCNESIDYSYTYKNCHFFGELAVDKNLGKAFINGLLASLSPAVDLSLVFRSINRNYQSFNANAFTENTTPVNEKGLFAGICIRPSESIQINAYTDGYHFPWLKYRVDAPSSGREYFVQVLYKPVKQVELCSYFSNEIRQQNISNGSFTTSILENSNRQSWRIHCNISLSRTLIIRNRVETIIYNKKQADEEEGFLIFTDILYKPLNRHWSGNMRLQYFETSGYNSRLYAFENDVLYNFSVPAVFDKGYRYYFNLNVDISKWMQYFFSRKISAECWFRASQTIYSSKNIISSGPDTINGNKKSEIKFQVMLSL